MSATPSCDITGIHDEDVLRRMWQETQDFSRKKEIRSHMYKIREARLRDFYSSGEVGKEIQRTNSSPGFREQQKGAITTHHTDLLGDHSFLSLKSKEIRDSESPTRDISYKINEKVSTDRGWTVNESNERSQDGKTHTSSRVATTAGSEKIDGGKLDYAAKNEHVASVYQDGDEHNFTKSIGASNKSVVQQEARGGDANSSFYSSSKSSKSSSKVVTEHKSSEPVEMIVHKSYAPEERQNHPSYVDGNTRVFTETKTLPDGSTVTTTRYETRGGKSTSKISSTSSTSQHVTSGQTSSKQVISRDDLDNIKIIRQQQPQIEICYRKDNDVKTESKHHETESVRSLHEEEKQARKQTDQKTREERVQRITDGQTERREPSQQTSTITTTTTTKKLDGRAQSNEFIDVEKHHTQQFRDRVTTTKHHDSPPTSPTKPKPVTEAPYQQPQKRQPAKPHPSNLDTKSQPTDGQYETTYRSEFTNKRISVDISPTHDAFARSLRSVTPEREKTGSVRSLRTSTTSLRSSTSPEKMRHPTRYSPERRKNSTTRTTTTTTTTTSNYRTAEVDSSNFRKKTTSRSPSPLIKTVSRSPSPMKTTREIDSSTLTRRSKKKPHPRSPSPSTTVSDFEFHSTRSELVTDLDDISRPSTLELTTKRSHPKEVRRGTPSPTKEVPRKSSLRSSKEERALRRTDTYEERCRQILGIVEKKKVEKNISDILFSDRHRSPTAERKPSLPHAARRPSKSPDKAVTVKTTVKVSPREQVVPSRRKSPEKSSPSVQEFPSQVKRTPEKEPGGYYPEKKPINKFTSTTDEFPSQIKRTLPKEQFEISPEKKSPQRTPSGINEFPAQRRTSPVKEPQNGPEFPSQIRRTPERETAEKKPTKQTLKSTINEFSSERKITSVEDTQSEQEVLSHIKHITRSEPSDRKPANKGGDTKQPLEPSSEKKVPQKFPSAVIETPPQRSTIPDREQIEPHSRKQSPTKSTPAVQDFPSQARRTPERESLMSHPAKKSENKFIPSVEEPTEEEPRNKFTPTIEEFPSQVKRTPTIEPLEVPTGKKPETKFTPTIDEFPSQVKRTPTKEPLELPPKKTPESKFTPTIQEFPSQVKRIPTKEPLEVPQEKRPDSKFAPTIEEFPSQAKRTPTKEPLELPPEKKSPQKVSSNIAEFPSQRRITPDRETSQPEKSTPQNKRKLTQPYEDETPSDLQEFPSQVRRTPEREFPSEINPCVEEFPSQIKRKPEKKVPSSVNEFPSQKRRDTPEKERCTPQKETPETKTPDDKLKKKPQKLVPTTTIVTSAQHRIDGVVNIDESEFITRRKTNKDVTNEFLKSERKDLIVTQDSEDESEEESVGVVEEQDEFEEVRLDVSRTRKVISSNEDIADDLTEEQCLVDVTKTRKTLGSDKTIVDVEVREGSTERFVGVTDITKTRKDKIILDQKSVDDLSESIIDVTRSRNDETIIDREVTDDLTEVMISSKRNDFTKSKKVFESGDKKTVVRKSQKEVEKKPNETKKPLQIRTKVEDVDKMHKPRESSPANWPKQDIRKMPKPQQVVNQVEEVTTIRTTETRRAQEPTMKPQKLISRKPKVSETADLKRKEIPVTSRKVTTTAYKNINDRERVLMTNGKPKTQKPKTPQVQAAEDELIAKTVKYLDGKRVPVDEPLFQKKFVAQLGSDDEENEPVVPKPRTVKKDLSKTVSKDKYRINETIDIEIKGVPERLSPVKSVPSTKKVITTKNKLVSHPSVEVKPKVAVKENKLFTKTVQEKKVKGIIEVRIPLKPVQIKTKPAFEKKQVHSEVIEVTKKEAIKKTEKPKKVVSTVINLSPKMERKLLVKKSPTKLTNGHLPTDDDSDIETVNRKAPSKPKPKLEKKCVSTKSIIINNAVADQREIIVDLQRSKSSREETPDDVWPVITEDDSGIPRYPDRITEPEDFSRKPVRRTIDVALTESQDVTEFSRVTEVKETAEDECLLSVTEKVNKFTTREPVVKQTGPAPKVGRPELVIDESLQSDECLLSVTDKVNKFILTAEKLTSSNVPERPKSPRCQNVEFSDKINKFANIQEPEEHKLRTEVVNDEYLLDLQITKDETTTRKVSLDDLTLITTEEDVYKPQFINTPKESKIVETPKSSKRVPEENITLSSIIDTELAKPKQKDIPKSKVTENRRIFEEDKCTPRKPKPEKPKEPERKSPSKSPARDVTKAKPNVSPVREPVTPKHKDTPIPQTDRPKQRDILSRPSVFEGRNPVEVRKKLTYEEVDEPDEPIPHYMKQLDRSLREKSPHKQSVLEMEEIAKGHVAHSSHEDLRPTKFGVTLKRTDSERVTTERRRSSTVMAEIDGVHKEMTVEEIYDVELLESMLETVIGYELRRRIRSQIRVVKKLISENKLSKNQQIVITQKITREKIATKPEEIVRKISPERSSYKVTREHTTAKPDEIVRKISPDRSSQKIIRERLATKPEDIVKRSSPDRSSPAKQHSIEVTSRRDSTTRTTTEHQHTAERRRSSEVRRTSITTATHKSPSPDKTSPVRKQTAATKVFTAELKRVAPAKKASVDDKPEWATKKLRNVNERSVTTKTTAAASTTIKSAKQERDTVSPKKDGKATDVITSSYGVGPTDEHGTPLFGLRALRAQNKNETTKVQGTVMQSSYYTENGSEPVGEISVIKYSTDPKDLGSTEDLEFKDGVLAKTTTQRFGYKDTPSYKTVTDKKRIEDSKTRTTTSSKVTRRGSVKEMTQKFIDNAVETSKGERQSSYPKAGLILRSSSFKESGSSNEHSQDEDDETRKTVTVTSKTSTTSRRRSSADTFLSSTSKVSNVQDVLSRMKAEDYVEGESVDDAEAKALLNKFLGSQVIIHGTEGQRTTSTNGKASSRSMSASASTSRGVTKVTTTITENGVPRTTTRTFTHPVSLEVLETVWDEGTLKLLLDQSSEYEERRIIRARLKKVMAEKEVTEQFVEDTAKHTESGNVEESVETTTKTLTEGPLTRTQVTTTRVTSSQQVSAKKPLSPFAKFRQLDKQNSLNTPPSTPKTPTSGGPLFKFTDPNVSRSAATIKERLLQWCQMKTKEYENIKLDNFSTSWADGLAFCALIHHFLPEAFDYHQLTPANRRHNFTLAFTVADEKADIYPLLDVDDMVATRKPDWKCVFTYVQAIYKRFKDED